MAILAPPRAIFELLPRAKNSKLGKTKNCTSRTTPNDARNTKKFNWIDFGNRLGQNEDYIKMAILAPGAIFELLPGAKNQN